MLAELRVRDLGVIADLRLLLEPGMTALTGETGAGKTLLVEAIELLVGGRADTVLVRPGASEARVEARFVSGAGAGAPAGPDGAAGVGQGPHPPEEAGAGAAGPDGNSLGEVVVARIVPGGGGRSRAYVDGRMAPASALADVATGRVDLHGQHTHQSLLSPAVQRAALDDFAGIDLRPLAEARSRLAEATRALADLGGDSRARAREADLLRYQLAELDAARLEDPDEDEALAVEEERLADAAAHRAAAAAAREALAGDGGASDALGTAVALLAGSPPLAELHSRLRALAAEVAEAASDVRVAGEELEEDPERLAVVRARRQQLRDLRRKYGETLADVISFAAEAGDRLTGLEAHDGRVAALEGEAGLARAALAAEARRAGDARREAAPRLATAIAENLHALAMPGARFDIVVEPPEAREGRAEREDERVTFLLGVNPGEPALPLARVASGGELARTMLAARLVLSGVSGPGAEGPATLVFDEVDAGIGGEAAIAVGRALAALAARHQVLVVTHLPQVAAFADHQVAVVKEVDGGRTVARAEVLDEAGRVVELSRMLSGQPTSASARVHARELLETVAVQRAESRP